MKVKSFFPGQISNEAFIFHICSLWGKTFSLVSRSRLNIKALAHNSILLENDFDTVYSKQVPAWQGGSGEGEDMRSALTVKGVAVEQNPKDFGTRSAPSMCDHCFIFASLYYSTLPWN